MKGHLDRRRDVIATLKSLGATGSGVFTIYLTQVIALAALGALPGLAVGAAPPFLIAWDLAQCRRCRWRRRCIRDLALALLYGC